MEIGQYGKLQTKSGDIVDIIICSEDQKEVKVITVDKKMVYTINKSAFSRLVKLEEKSVDKMHPMFYDYKKGDILEFVDTENKTQVAIVIKNVKNSGLRTKVKALWLKDLSTLWTFSTTVITSINKAKLPFKLCDPKSDFEGWNIVGYKRMESLSEETVCFHAVITFDKKKVIEVSNHGCGGPNNYHHLGDKEMVDKFFVFAKEQFQKVSKRKPFEPEDLVVTWLAEQKSLGIPFGEYVKRVYH